MRSISERLVGCWRLASYEFVSEDGDKQKPVGDDPAGTILYTPDGYMSAQIAKPRPYDGDDLPIAYYVAYSGSYEVDEAAGIVTHRVEVSVIPSWVGSAQQRRVRFRGPAELELSQTTIDPSGKRVTHTLTWLRAPLRS